MLGRTGRTALSGLAVALVASVAIPLPAASAAETLSIAPATEGDRGVRGGLPLSLQGTVPEGGARAVLLEALAADGRVLDDIRINNAIFQPEPSSGGDFIAVDGTSVRGRLTLTSLFSGPGVSGAPAQDVRQVRVVLCGASGASQDELVAACRQPAAPLRGPPAMPPGSTTRARTCGSTS